MDAKPHRPLRGVGSVNFASENLIGSRPSIYQQHNPMGNMKPIAGGDGLKAGPKRPAFTDLSNISRAIADIGTKGESKERVPIFSTTREGPTADKENIPSSGAEAFRQPAQRNIGYTARPVVSILATSSISTSNNTLPATKPSSILSHTNNHFNTLPLTESRLPAISKPDSYNRAFEDRDFVPHRPDLTSIEHSTLDHTSSHYSATSQAGLRLPPSSNSDTYNTASGDRDFPSNNPDTYTKAFVDRDFWPHKTNVATAGSDALKKTSVIFVDPDCSSSGQGELPVIPPSHQSAVSHVQPVCNVEPQYSTTTSTTEPEMPRGTSIVLEDRAISSDNQDNLSVAPPASYGTTAHAESESQLAQPGAYNMDFEVRDMLPAGQQDYPAAPHYSNEVMTGQPAENLRRYQSQPQLRAEQHAVVRRTQSRHFGNSDELDIHYDDNATEASYADALEHLPEQVDQTTQADQPSSVANNSPSYSPGPREGDATTIVTAATYSASVPEQAVSDQDSAAATAVGEEAEEGEDFDGELEYATAHSFGDNTTIGATTVLDPAFTADVLEELAAAKFVVEDTMTEEEVEEEAWDISMAAEYVDEIMDHMKFMENKLRPNPHYMDIQTEMQWSMRSILMEWVVQVHARFNLLPETLFLAVNCIDRFLSVKPVSIAKLQLVGATALLVAAKYEEVSHPSLEEMQFMVSGGYDALEIRKAERFMLSMLKFDLGWPGPMSFLRRISKADDYDLQTRTLAKYLLEVTILDERFVACTPSFLAAGAHCLSRLLLQKRGGWTLYHVHYSGYTLRQLRQVMATMLQCCHNPRKHHPAVYDKYNTAKYKRASAFAELEVAKGFTLPFYDTPCLSSQASSPGSDGSKSSLEVNYAG